MAVKKSWQQKFTVFIICLLLIFYLNFVAEKNSIKINKNIPMAVQEKNKEAVSYRQPDAPKSSVSPLEVLNANPYLTQSSYQKYGYTTVGGCMGALTVYLFNFYRKRPYFAGIHLYPIAIGIGVVSVSALQKFREQQWAERDAIFRHYISLHPEDFPAYQRVKISDVFEPWTPVR